MRIVLEYADARLCNVLREQLHGLAHRLYVALRVAPVNEQPRQSELIALHSDVHAARGARLLLGVEVQAVVACGGFYNDGGKFALRQDTVPQHVMPECEHFVWTS